MKYIEKKCDGRDHQENEYREKKVNNVWNTPEWGKKRQTLKKNYKRSTHKWEER